MEQTGADAPEQARHTALHPHLSPLSPPAGQQHPAVVDEDRGARGEHVHSEPAPPVPTPGAPGAARMPKAPGQLERHSVRAQILTALREALLSGELVPGEVYSAPALAERFGVSATPVREAMQRLVCEGAIETVPNRGFRVAVCSARDLTELAEIRALLEIPSVLQAARTMLPECWESLRPYADDALAAAALGDRATYADADSAFHGALLELTGNRQLVDVAADIQRRLQRRPAPLAPSVCAAELMQDATGHVALLDALKARDLPTVERLMREHVAL